MEVCIETRLERGMPVELFSLEEYDKILIMLSSGKDSVACTSHLLDLGVPPEKMELVHQCVDGKLDTHQEFFDWPITESYTEAFGRLLGIPVIFQWRAFGIYGELMRKDSLTGDVYQLREDGTVMHLPTKRGQRSTRLRWPALSADLSKRYCSAYAKIDVFRRALNNDPRYKGSKEHRLKLLVISGERREESPARAQYHEAELHACSNPFRTVHAWRPVIDWKEAQIWDIYEKRRLLPHYSYLLGWNRTSCFGCIFSTADLWAMMREIAPERFNWFVQREREIGHTIDPKMSLEQKANLGSLHRLPKDKRLSQWVQMALSRTVLKPEDLIMEKWELPAGAFRGASGGSM